MFMRNYLTIDRTNSDAVFKKVSVSLRSWFKFNMNRLQKEEVEDGYLKRILLKIIYSYFILNSRIKTDILKTLYIY